MKNDGAEKGTMAELRAAPARAAEFFGERFGERKSLSRRQAIDYVRLGWGVATYATVAELESAFDAAVGVTGPHGVTLSHKATFRVGYHMAAGCSAAGSSIGSRPVSCPMFTAESVRSWADVTFYRFAMAGDR